MLFFRLAHRVRSSLWLLPALCVLAGVILSLGTIALDKALGPRLIPFELTGDPDAALQILSTIATSMVDRYAEEGDTVPDRQGIGSGADVMVPVDAL